MIQEHFFHVPDYDLAATLDSGQVFRWVIAQGGDECHEFAPPVWTGIAKGKWVLLRKHPDGLAVQVVEPVQNWSWLEHYLQVDVSLREITATFPKDPVMQSALEAFPGLRLLRQDPWECLASFILSSTKQIVQIRQVITALSNCFGESVPTPAGFPPARAFPTPERLARASESELRACKMGFRAPYLLAAARAVAEGRLNLETISCLPLPDARSILMSLSGVGGKIADCVLLFAYGFQAAFPLDVWVARGLRQIYFRGRQVKLGVLRSFAAGYFGPYSGYAQQYLFHYLRTRPQFGEPNLSRRLQRRGPGKGIK